MYFPGMGKHYGTFKLNNVTGTWTLYALVFTFDAGEWFQFSKRIFGRQRNDVCTKLSGSTV